VLGNETGHSKSEQARGMMMADSGLSKPEWHAGLSKPVHKDDDSRLRIK
jgi:hypothetical protein